MNTRVLPAALAALSFLLLSSCASTPAAYYTLDMRPSANAPNTAAVSVGHVGLADTLAGGRMPVRTSPTQLDFYAAAQWAGNLAELVSEKFTAELGPASDADAILADIRLLAFEQQDLSEAHAQAYAKAEVHYRTAAMSRYEMPLLTRTYEVSAPMATMDAPGLSEALSRCAEDIARRIAADAAAVRP
jgi:uncharacterized lipoprotein YmbA